MKLVERPPVEVNGRGGDDLDQVLRAFFRSEMPSPWPRLALPDEAPAVLPLQPARPTQPRRWFRRSHLALAASVALLVIGHLVLSDTLKPSATAPDGMPDNPTANPRIPGIGPTKPPGNGADDLFPKGDGAGKPKDSYKLLESLLQEGDKPTELRITIIPNN
jgi:hypothetical protein